MELRLPALRALLSVSFLLRLKSSRIICGYYCFFRGEDACQESIARGEEGGSSDVQGNDRRGGVGED